MRELTPRFVERVWGSADLSPWYPAPPPSSGGLPYGEVWFEGESLLIKFLFPQEKLSVQVHPGDAYAREHEASNGKTEMWRVVRAEPGASIALGFREPVEREAARAAALDGSIMEMLDWREVRAGDSYLIPAGTVHAMGGGMVVAEIQQMSDVTYRLFDYGRGRELHVERGFDVAELGPYRAGEMRCAYFETVEVGARELVEPRSGEDYLIGLETGRVWRLEGTAQAGESSLHTWVAST
ncbi:MAG: class I mannose-6-phosphate isomerase [Acidobacteria bacterium]|nr:class I mannose-6-phosphate isomerase [Acidobacteriota bacterium]